MAYEHLRFSREAPLTDRHKSGFPRVPVPEDPRSFGIGLRRTFEVAKQSAADELAGYDDRILFKVQLREDVALPDLERIPGVTLVSHEDKSIVLAFADATGLEEFESRLTSLATNGAATRKELLYALESFDHWTAEDRKGAALRQQGFEESESFVLDVELWPLTRQDQRQALLQAFRNFLTE